MRGFEISAGDIIVSCAGTIGETYVVPDDFEQGIINQALMRMKIFQPMYIPYPELFTHILNCICKWLCIIRQLQS